MYSVKEIYTPSTLSEALTILSLDQDVQPLAGGTDILVKMRSKRPKDVVLMALQDIPGLDRIEQADGRIHIGPLSTFAEVAENPLIMSKLPMLRTAALSVGGPQVRNAATIGGNILNGAVSADSAPSLFALDAVLVLQSVHGTRESSILDFYLGPGKVARSHDEILTDIVIPVPPAQGWAGHYTKFSVRKAMDISMLGCAATCQVSAGGRVVRATVALGTAAPCPVRCTETEAYVQGKVLTDDVLETAADLALSAANPRTSWRASREYRLDLARQLVMGSLTEAWQKAKEAM